MDLDLDLVLDLDQDLDLDLGADLELDNYEGYDNALKSLRLEKLKDRRESLCLSFAKKCLRNEKVKSMFPLNRNKRSLRNQNNFIIKFAATERYRKSAVPHMQNLLNEHEKMKAKLVRFKGL